MSPAEKDPTLVREKRGISKTLNDMKYDLSVITTNISMTVLSYTVSSTKKNQHRHNKRL